MTYPVYLYNMLLAATYVVLAVVFFWLIRWHPAVWRGGS